MTKEAPKKSDIKKPLHPRNPHQERYEFDKLIKACPDLVPYVFKNQYNNLTIDFADANAVKMLNKSLLINFYGVANWDIPENYLCPPIPGRADYIHYLADLLAASNEGNIPKGKNIKVLDIGVGANCIYPIIGNKEYGWSFVGTDIDPIAVKSAKLIVKTNGNLAELVDCRLQGNHQHIFEGVIKPSEIFDVSISNPPFHASAAEAGAANARKRNNLGTSKAKQALNFGGQNTELWTEGGEIAFVRKMIDESAKISTQCFWFTTLISRAENLPHIYGALKFVNAKEVKTINMEQGQKKSRFVAWTFLDVEQQNEWRNKRWK
jgi:23S rRNA (adenine1618-N6)-methyltransferase